MLNGRRARNGWHPVPTEEEGYYENGVHPSPKTSTSRSSRACIAAYALLSNLCIIAIFYTSSIPGFSLYLAFDADIPLPYGHRNDRGDYDDFMPGFSDVLRVRQTCRWNAKRFDTSPFPSADAFRLHADFIFDDVKGCTELPDPKEFFPGCSIFVRTELLPKFFEHVHSDITVPYVLVSHNSDHDAPMDTRKKFGQTNIWQNYTNLTKEFNSNTLHAWFGVNMVKPELAPEKLFQIPIGVQNFRYYDPTGYARRFPNVTTSDRSSCLIFFAFREWTDHSRKNAYMAELRNSSDADFVNWEGKRDPEEWLDQVLKCKYVMAPRGNGWDTHRHWESLMMGAIPVTQKGPLSPMYEKLPMLIVDSYEEVNRELLESRYEELQARLEVDAPKLYSSYWFERIRRKQLEARALYFDETNQWTPNPGWYDAES